MNWYSKYRTPHVQENDHVKALILVYTFCPCSMILSTTLLIHFSTSLAHYSTHAQMVIRDNLKAIRTCNESLNDLKHCCRTVHRKADHVEKKLGKMGSEHQHLQIQTEAEWGDYE
jgi:GTP cyclohydrolase FolE2